MSGFSQNFADAMSSIEVFTEGLMKNGRVDLMSQMPTFNIANYQSAQPNNARYASEATAGISTPNETSRLYFSPENIDALHEAIRYRIYVETKGKYVIGRQSDVELKIVMRSIYLQTGIMADMGCIAAVRSLNTKVLEWVVPEVLSNLLQYEKYRIDASTLPMPMEHAPLMTSKGTKTLEFKSFF